MLFIALNCLGILVKRKPKTKTISKSLLPDPWLYPTDLYVQFYVNTTLSWLLKLCSVSLNCKGQVSQVCSFFPQIDLFLLHPSDFYGNFKLCLLCLSISRRPTQETRFQACPWDSLLIRLFEVESAHCGRHYSLSWDPGLHSKDKVSWMQAS